MRHVSRPHLQVHNGIPNDRSEGEQLRLGEGPNAAHMLRRHREAMRVAARGRRPAGQLAVFAMLAGYADPDGIAHVFASQLAADLERTKTNVCRDLRALAVDGLMQPLDEHPGYRGRKGYRVPLMVAPMRLAPPPGR